MSDNETNTILWLTISSILHSFEKVIQSDTRYRREI